MAEEQQNVAPLITSKPTREGLIAKLNSGEKLTDDEINALKYFNNEEEINLIDRVIRGVNDTFVKEYNFTEWKLKFTVKIKAPNAIDQGKIQALRESYLNGMGMSVSTFIYQVYQTLATIRICGFDLPKELEKDEDIYNLNILYIIGQDFNKWLATFRS